MADCCKAHYDHVLWYCCPHCGSAGVRVKFTQCPDCGYEDPIEYQYDDNYQDGYPC